MLGVWCCRVRTLCFAAFGLLICWWWFIRCICLLWIGCLDLLECFGLGNGWLLLIAVVGLILVGNRGFGVMVSAWLF